MSKPGVGDIDYDENCDADNPRKIEYEQVLAASRRIVGQIVRTPCMKTEMSESLGMDLYIKMEFLQFTGSFKERGLRNTLLLLTEEQRKYGVVAASTGNHGCAVSYHSTQMGIPSIVVMPVYAALTKVNNCEKLGAKLVMYGTSMAEAIHHAMGLAKEKKMVYINGFDHPNVIEGQGSVGIEIIEQVPDVEAVLCPCGGGSLLTGVAVAVKYLKPDTEIYGVETDKTCSMTESFKKNERVFLPIPDSTIADGLGVNRVGVNTFNTLREGLVDKMWGDGSRFTENIEDSHLLFAHDIIIVAEPPKQLGVMLHSLNGASRRIGFGVKLDKTKVVVKEEWVARAIMHLIEKEKFVVEGAGATAVASLMAGLLPKLKGKKVVCVCTGGNIDITTMGRALERGMSTEGRLVKFKVTVQDRPIGLADLCALLASIGVTLRDCVPDRAWIKGDVFSCELKVLVETKGWPHVEELMEAIKKHFKNYFFPEMTGKPDSSPGPRRGPCLAPNPVCMQR